jgi:hypothetical protein
MILVHVEVVRSTNSAVANSP